MYKSLYKLESEPFEPHPDPSFLWLGGKHTQALSTLRYGILDNLGFVLLIGAAGTGKTLLLNELTGGLKSEVIWSVVADPKAERVDFYNKIGTGFGLKSPFISKVQFLIQFSHFLYKAHDAGKKVVLFVDDCHLLSQELLEELLLLSNIEKSDTGLIDIFLAGQPEFNERLVQPANKAIRQRLGLKAKLSPLASGETVEYIKHRLKISGSVENIFSARAFQMIQRYSQGIPRSINIICREALQAGALQGEKSIDHKRILECVEKLKLPALPEERDIKPLPAVKKPAERPRDTAVARSVDHQNTVTAIGPIAGRRKRRVLLLCTLSFLLCIGLGGYFSYSKKDIIDIQKATESEGVASEQDTAVAPAAEVISVSSPAVEARENDNGTVSKLKQEAGGGELPLEKISDRDFGAKEQQTLETVSLESGEVATGTVSGGTEVEDKVLETLAVLPPLEVGKIILGFQPGSIGLTLEADSVLAEFVELLLQYPNARILVKGFVSSNNDTLENMQLSVERAKSVEKLLIARGIGKAQIEVRGMGIRDPIATNDTAAGRLKNRRAEIEVIDDGV